MKLKEIIAQAKIAEDKLEYLYNSGRLSLAEEPLVALVAAAELLNKQYKHPNLWLNCPICGESDMRKEVLSENESYINCRNINCGSNGGENITALAKELGSNKEGL